MKNTTDFSLMKNFKLGQIGLGEIKHLTAIVL